MGVGIVTTLDDVGWEECIPCTILTGHQIPTILYRRAIVVGGVLLSRCSGVGGWRGVVVVDGKGPAPTTTPIAVGGRLPLVGLIVRWLVTIAGGVHPGVMNTGWGRLSSTVLPHTAINRTTTTTSIVVMVDR